MISDVHYIEWWTYKPCKCPPPLRGVVGLYDQRIRIGKDTSAGKSYKLIYNSMYGKFAQSVGNPKYGNSLYASLITSGCRTMILDAIATHPEGTNAVLMVATDGVYFRSPHPSLPISERLGEWDTAVHRNLCLFKPGVYWDDSARERIAKGDDPSFKARGINAGAFASAIKDIDNAFHAWPQQYPGERDPDGPRDEWFPKITFHSGFSMITCQQALQRNKWFLAGAVGDAELTQDADPIAKRHSGWYDAEHGIYYSTPYDTHGWELESTPYDKTFGSAGDPSDPEEYGISPDGPVLDAWKGLLFV